MPRSSSDIDDPGLWLFRPLPFGPGAEWSQIIGIVSLTKINNTKCTRFCSSSANFAENVALLLIGKMAKGDGFDLNFKWACVFGRAEIPSHLTIS